MRRLLRTSMYVSMAGWLVLAAGPTSLQSAPASRAAFEKILFLGNSITLHGPNKNIGWTGNWGMAASVEDKDYVHLVTRALTANNAVPPKIMVRNIAEFERQYATYDAEAKLKDAIAFGADLIIVAIGENTPALSSAGAQTQFGVSLGKLLRHFQSDKRPLLIVRSCFWANPDKDRVLKQACQEAGGVFVDIGHLGKDESNFARSERSFEHKGVAGHPGDQGMKAIAGAILEAIRKHQGKKTNP